MTASPNNGSGQGGEQRSERAGECWMACAVAIITIATLSRMVNRDPIPVFVAYMLVPLALLAALWLLAKERPRTIVLGGVTAAGLLLAVSFSGCDSSVPGARDYSVALRLPSDAGLVHKVVVETPSSSVRPRSLRSLGVSGGLAGYVATFQFDEEEADENVTIQVHTDQEWQPFEFKWRPSSGRQPARSAGVARMLVAAAQWVVVRGEARLSMFPADVSASCTTLVERVAGPQAKIRGVLRLLGAGGAVELSLAGLWSFVLNDELDVCRIKSRFNQRLVSHLELTAGVDYAFEFFVDSREDETVVRLTVGGETFQAKGKGPRRTVPYYITLTAYGCGVSVAEIRVEPA